MKKPTLYFKILAFICLLGMTHGLQAQSPCYSTFVYTINPGGTVTFSNTSANSSTATAFNWAVNNVYGTYTGQNPTMTFTANGNYVITLQTTNYSPSCTAQSTQTIALNGITCALNANFVFSPSSTGGLINFTNASSGSVPGTTYLWDFGDNSPTSTSASPAHTYSANGVYSATLMANNNFTSACTSTVVKSVQVCNYGTPLNAAYAYTINSGGNVNFNSTSTGVNPSTFYSWKTGTPAGINFSGYFVFSSGVNVTTAAYTFTANGPYYTTLTIMDPVTTCSAVTGQTVIINGSTTGCNLTADFYPVQGIGGSMTLNNASNGTVPGTTYFWNFGDGTTGTTASPVHTYSADGVYTATLTVNNNTSPTCTATIVKTVKVCGYNPPNASYVYTANNNGNVTFTSTSTGVNPGTLYTWSAYGAGGTFGSGVNLTQASGNFSYNGTHYVNLSLVDPVTTCANTSSQTIVVTTACMANAAFSVASTNTAQVWTILPASPSNVVAAEWTWGDGSTSNTLYTNHTYSAAGYYPICLSVTVSCGATNTFCSTWYVFKGSDSNDMIQVEVLDPNSTVGIKNNTSNLLSGAISPNPNNGLFNLKMNGLSGDVNVLLYDVTGKVIYQQTAELNNGNLSKEIQLNEVPNGIYFLKANSNGKTFSSKIIIEK